MICEQRCTSFDGSAVKQVAKYVCVWLEEEGLAHCINEIISENRTKLMEMVSKTPTAHLIHVFLFQVKKEES